MSLPSFTMRHVEQVLRLERREAINEVACAVFGGVRLRRN